MTDTNDNAAVQVTRTVNVVDTTVPVITRIGANPVTIEVGSSYIDAGATASDIGDGDLTGAIVTVNPVDADVIGVYTVPYNVTDASLKQAVQVTRTVNVVDTTAPLVTLIGAKTVTVEVGSAYVDAGATAVDLVDGDLSELDRCHQPGEDEGRRRVCDQVRRVGLAWKSRQDRHPDRQGRRHDGPGDHVGW